MELHSLAIKAALQEFKEVKYNMIINRTNKPSLNVVLNINEATLIPQRNESECNCSNVQTLGK